ncbi:hypothetical protein E2562_007632 [Oryza meyeriana var. granulata]|uniref:Uncharacterized protein n=1 Tax=Oryza meyeriana var. granulata TaxID=110450 RepID=A0A6G1DVR2_9ORYZ|nr:hypothetical protein E2562_007632 [Oryza meyeriana var. granulata]
MATSPPVHRHGLGCHARRHGLDLPEHHSPVLGLTRHVCRRHLDLPKSRIPVLDFLDGPVCYSRLLLNLLALRWRWRWLREVLVAATHAAAASTSLRAGPVLDLVFHRAHLHGLHRPVHCSPHPP